MADMGDSDNRTCPAVASLAPGQANPDVAKSNQPAPPDIPRLLQTELRRGGSKTPQVDGEREASSPPAPSSLHRPTPPNFPPQHPPTHPPPPLTPKTPPH